MQASWIRLHLRSCTRRQALIRTLPLSRLVLSARREGGVACELGWRRDGCTVVFSRGSRLGIRIRTFLDATLLWVLLLLLLHRSSAQDTSFKDCDAPVLLEPASARHRRRPRFVMSPPSAPLPCTCGRSLATKLRADRCIAKPVNSRVFRSSQGGFVNPP